MPVCAQDAAAPSRRTSPTPAEQQEPSEAREPETTPTPARVQEPEEPASARPTPEPPAAESPASQAESSAAAAPQPAQSAAPGTPAKVPDAPSSRPGRRIINEKPVRAVEPRPTSARRPWTEDPTPAVGASRPTFDLSKAGGGSVSATVRRLEQRWQQAIRERDAKTIGELIAPDFVGTSSTGRVGSKSTLLSEVRRDKNQYTSAEARSMSVRTESDNVAVVTGISRESGTTPDGKRFKTSRRFTDTWVKRNGKWRCIASHTTAIPKR